MADIQVGIHESAITSLFQDIFWDVVAVLAVSLLVALELLLFFLAMQIKSPFLGIINIVNRIRKGDFTTRYQGQIGGEVGDACRSVDVTVRRVNERFHDLELESEEIRASQIDKGVVAKIDSLMNRIKQDYRFSLPGKEQELTHENAQRIRVPLFIFMFSEELSRSFIPLFASTIYKEDPTYSLSTDLAIGLPITIFMAVVAIMTPVAGGLTDRFGARRVFVAGALLATLGYALTVVSYDFLGFLASRSVSALGYGLVFIASQGYIAEATQAKTRARNMTIFVGAVLIAGVCGPAIGGILADRIGYRATFAISIAFSLISAFMAYRVLAQAEAKRAKVATNKMGVAGYGALLGNIQFMSITFLIAIPTKIVLAGIIFYLTPVFLWELGSSQSTIGRIMMIYGIVTVIFSPICAQYADRNDAHRTMVIAGGFMTALSCLAILTSNSTPAVLLAVAGIGLSHAMSLPNQLAIIQEIGEEQNLPRASVMSGYRLLERIGTVIGPIIVGLLLLTVDHQQTMAAMGVMVGLSTFAFLALMLSIKLRARKQETA